MIDLTVQPEIQKKNIEFSREKKIVLPTFALMTDPDKIPLSIP